jgi:Spy/CpxP family protein refolding chaperone
MNFQTIVRSTLVAAAFLATFSLSAQTRPAPSTAKPKMTREDHDQKRRDDMARELELTPEQQDKWAKADKKYDDKAKDVRSDNKEEMEKLRNERIRAHKALMTRKQSDKYDEILARKEAHHQKQAGKKADKKHGKGKKAPESAPSTPATGKASDKFHKD